PPLTRAHRPAAARAKRHLVRLPVVKNAYSVVPPAAKKQPPAPNPPIVSDTIGAPVAIGGPLDVNAAATEPTTSPSATTTTSPGDAAVATSDSVPATIVEPGPQNRRARSLQDAPVSGDTQPTPPPTVDPVPPPPAVDPSVAAVVVGSTVEPAEAVVTNPPVTDVSSPAGPVVTSSPLTSAGDPSATSQQQGADVESVAPVSSASGSGTSVTAANTASSGVADQTTGATGSSDAATLSNAPTSADARGPPAPWSVDLSADPTAHDVTV